MAQKSEFVRIVEILPTKISSEKQEIKTLVKEGVRVDEIEAIKWAKEHGFYN